MILPKLTHLQYGSMPLVFGLWCMFILNIYNENMFYVVSNCVFDGFESRYILWFDQAVCV